MPFRPSSRAEGPIGRAGPFQPIRGAKPSHSEARCPVDPFRLLGVTTGSSSCQWEGPSRSSRQGEAPWSLPIGGQGQCGSSPSAERGSIGPLHGRRDDGVSALPASRKGAEMIVSSLVVSLPLACRQGRGASACSRQFVLRWLHLHYIGAIGKNMYSASRPPRGTHS